MSTEHHVTSEGVSLGDIGLTERVQQIRDAYFRAIPEICVERPRLVTGYHLKHGLLEKGRISSLEKARAYRYVLSNRAGVIWHTQAHDKQNRPFSFVNESLLAGGTTSKFKGVPLYPELTALTIWPELQTIGRRKRNPYHITESEAAELNYRIFPHWLDKSILELARVECGRQGTSGGNGPAPDFQLLQYLVFFLASKVNCITHSIPDLSRAVNEGLRQIIGEAQEKAAAAEDAKRDFYLAVSEALEGIIAYSHRLADRAEQLAGAEPDPSRKTQLEDLARIHRRVPERPAQTFREAVTTIWICWIALHLENVNEALSLGRLDQLLWKFYRQDIDAKRLEVADAIELICCLWLKIGDHVPMVPEAAEQLFGGTGSNQAITIGGVDCQGRDAVNDLSYVMLRATELMMLRDPNLNARYFAGVNSPEYLRALSASNIRTGATPALHNDQAVIRVLRAKDENLEHAWDYGVVGCVEPSSCGRHYGASSSLLVNLTSVLELTLYNGCHRHTGLDRLISIRTGNPDEFADFEQFRSALRQQLRWLAEAGVSMNNCLGRIHQAFYPTPILSALFQGPMDKGEDLIDGGAIINSSGVTIIGLADVADSLSAIRKLVFEERSLDLAQLLDALKKDFRGREDLQHRLMNPEKTPKYGNEDPQADENVAWLMRVLDEEFSGRENYRGGQYRVGYWTMTNHAGFGRLTGALPSGRKAHENFTSGITPVSGVTPSLTKTLNSVAGLPVECAANGMAFNVKYTPESGAGEPDETMLTNFTAAAAGYFDQGGMEIQFNVTDHDTFVDASGHPHDHPELLVRVSGYTAYFKDLSPQMQKEIVDRTEYRLSTGEAEDFPPFPLP